jgi:hypothetical protein
MDNEEDFEFISMEHISLDKAFGGNEKVLFLTKCGTVFGCDCKLGTLTDFRLIADITKAVCEKKGETDGN